MDREKIGALIARLRREQGMTQRELAERIQVSDKAVSKWERGLGCPDVSILTQLSDVLGIELITLLSGSLPSSTGSGGNMKKTKFFVCPACGSVSMTTGSGEMTCCGRKLAALEAQKAAQEDKLTAERVEDEWFITASHPMTKAHHIAFVAFLSGERVQLVRTYPEWDLQVRFPARGHGTLLWYCTEHGLFYQYQ